MAQEQRRRWALAVFGLALLARLVLVWSPMETQIAKTIPDDAYYYFLTARNILEGEGFSIDGRNGSNGWHPLWMLVNLAVFAMTPEALGPNAPIYVLLTLAALCDSAVAALLFLQLRSHLPPVPALTGGLAYAFNGMLIFQAGNGLETALSALCLALAWWQSLRFIADPRPRQALLWGAAFGLTFLARTDNALILVPLGLYVLWRLPTAKRPWVGVAGVLAALLISPWWVWNQVQFGSPFVQVSSIAVPYAVRERFSAANPDSPLWELGLNTLTRPYIWLSGEVLGAIPLLSIPLWGLALYGFWRSWRTSPSAHIGLLLLAGGLALIFVHTFIRAYPRTWYFAVMGTALAFGLAHFVATFHKAGRRFLYMIVCLEMLLFGTAFMWPQGYHPWQADQYAAGLWARDNTPPDAVLASINTGLIAYYSGRTVINMDGVVNPQAFEAIQARRMVDYMREEGVQLFIEFDYFIHEEYALFMGAGYREALRESALIAENEHFGGMRAYTLTPR
jgi:hypothetical protein